MKIIHILRTPVGGLFRHVKDLVEGQAVLGHDVGVISGFPAFQASWPLESLEPFCSLGVHRIAMSRWPGFSDLFALKGVIQRCRRIRGDVILHGHGSKGGLYARLVGAFLRKKSVYAPHGGSLHYSPKTISGSVFLHTEAFLSRLTDGFVFTCHYEKKIFEEKIGLSKPFIVAYNGLREHDFLPIPCAPEARDILFLGELRLMKGIDLLLKAMALLKKERPVSAFIVGDGPDRAVFEEQAKQLGLSENVVFPGPLPAQKALSLGRVFVLPSRHESFPYVILEALAAGKPVIASDVGGISEVLAKDNLFPAEDDQALAVLLQEKLWMKQGVSSEKEMGRLKAQCSWVGMVEQITGHYATL